ncbi:hypothetical protein IJU97_03815 [bacterium]|nr:hypothetical protein [bacterium]
MSQAVANNQNQETFLNMLQKSFYESKGGLTEDDINNWIKESNVQKYYPKVNAKDILDLQSSITPTLLQTGEYVDNSQIAERYPNLYNKTDVSKIIKANEEANNKWQDLINRVNKANPNALSEN